jgi:hypothetical protein
MIGGGAPHATPQLLSLFDSDDEDYRKILTLEQPLHLPFQFQELSGPKHMPPPNSPPIAYFHLFFIDLILLATEFNRYEQQVITSKAANVPTLLKNWTRITMHEIKGFLACTLNMGIIKKPTIASYWSTLFPKAPHDFGKRLPPIAVSHKGYHVFVDNSFSSTKPLLSLLIQNTS